MRFETRLREGIHDGSITMVFRRWKRTQVVPGGHYRTGVDMVEVEAVDVVTPGKISKADLRRAGYPTRAALLADLRGDPDDRVFRIALHRLDTPDPRDVLSADDDLSDEDVAAIDQRLDRLDRASPRGPWTAAALNAIAREPGRRAPDLAAAMGMETVYFKRNIRTLKGMGLTHSLTVGYRLAPRGKAYLDRTRRAG